MLLLAWAYVKFGALPQAGWLLYGVKPVVIAIIIQALWNLGGKAIKNIPTALVMAVIMGLYFLGINELVLLFGGGLVVMLVSNLRRLRAPTAGAMLLPLGGTIITAVASITTAIPFSLPLMFLTFCKIGSVLYGSGYVLLAFLRADFVAQYGWLTDAQLMDAIAIGQVTPGPLFTTATFIGYQLSGVPGARLARSRAGSVILRMLVSVQSVALTWSLQPTAVPGRRRSCSAFQSIGFTAGTTTSQATRPHRATTPDTIDAEV